MERNGHTPGHAPAAPEARTARREAPSPRINYQKLFDRLPPHSLEAEMSLLGSMILDYRVTGDVIGLVPSADSFYSEAHAAIFEALVKNFDLHHSGDLVQLTELLKDKEVLDDVGGASYLVQLAESVPSSVNAPHYARIVRDKAQLRKLIDAAGQILHDAYSVSGNQDESARQVLDIAEQRIFDIVDKSVGLDSEALSRLLQQTIDRLDARSRDGRSLTGLATGYFDLDEISSGLQKGEMIVIAARPSMGKTALALNLAEQIAFGGQAPDEGGPHAPIAFFSMEMSRQSITERLLCAHSGVDSHKMRKNLLKEEDWRRLMDSCSRLSDAPVYVDDTPGLTILMLRAKARRMAKQHGIRCIFIDYLQLMSAPLASREGRQQEVSSISRGAKALARELNIPVVCLAQLNREAESREGHRPRMADLRESGSIEQDADVVMLLHREEYYHQGDEGWLADNEDKVGLAEIIIAKQRNGPTGTVNLTWDPATTRFKNHQYRRGSGGGGAGGGSSFPGAARSHSMPVPRGTYDPDPGASSASGSRLERKPFAPGGKSGPIQGHRDGGGPDRPDPIAPEAPRGWEDEDVDNLPI